MSFGNNHILPIKQPNLSLIRMTTYCFLITTQAKRNLSNRSGIGGVLSAT